MQAGGSSSSGAAAALSARLRALSCELRNQPFELCEFCCLDKAVMLKPTLARSTRNLLQPAVAAAAVLQHLLVSCMVPDGACACAHESKSGSAPHVQAAPTRRTCLSHACMVHICNWSRTNRTLALLTPHVPLHPGLHSMEKGWHYPILTSHGQC